MTLSPPLSLHTLAVLDLLHGFALGGHRHPVTMHPPLPGHLLPRLSVLPPRVDACALRIIRPQGYLQDLFDLHWPSTGAAFGTPPCGVYPVGDPLWTASDFALRLGSQLLQDAYPVACAELQAACADGPVPLDLTPLQDVQGNLLTLIRSLSSDCPAHLNIWIGPGHTPKEPQTDLYPVPYQGQMIDLEADDESQPSEDTEWQVMTHFFRVVTPDHASVPRTGIVLRLGGVA